jgi:hypothetical protein
MRPHSIRWKPHTPLAAKRACAEWLRGKGYMPIPRNRHHWAIKRAYQ